jgi:hypothetical protein
MRLPNTHLPVLADPRAHPRLPTAGCVLRRDFLHGIARIAEGSA